MAFDAFISYSSKDKTTADAACATLESAGIRCWIAPRDIRGGLEYATGIIEGIDASRVMVLIFSSSANASPQIHREIERAVSKGLTIIPLRIEEITPTKAMEYYLGSIHWLDALTPPLARHLQELAETVKADLQVDPNGQALAAGMSLSQAPVHKLESSGAKPRLLIAILAAFAVLSVAALAMAVKAGLLASLFGSPALPVTAEQQILLNIVRASYGDPIQFSLPTSPNFSAAIQNPITLDQLLKATSNGNPPELISWLFADSFELDQLNTVLGFNYDPPNDYGCSQRDPKNRCFVDWVQIATLTGLTVEEVQLAGTGAQPALTTFARLCFDPSLSERAFDAMTSDQSAAIVAKLDVTPTILFGSPLKCGSPWNPTVGANVPQPVTLPLIIGPLMFKISPRSAYGVLQFLGTLLNVQRQHLQPASGVYIPPGRNDVTAPPTLLTIHDDPNLLTITPKGAAPCFAEARYNNVDYCVPSTATTTKDIFGFLIQLTGLSNVPSQ
jgi:hypothetical protein